METQHMKDLVRRVTEALNTRDEAAIRTLYVDGGMHHSMKGTETTMSHDDTWASIEAMVASVPDLRFELRALVAEGDTVAVRWQMRGTHTGEGGVLAPTGRSFDVPFWAHYRIEEGRIAESWTLFDALGRLVQLGIVEDPATARATASA